MTTKQKNELTEEQAIALAGSGWWKGLPARQVAEFQLNTERLCMPFGEFHRAVEETLGHPVWSHQFADPEALLQELYGERLRPTFVEVLEMIPAEKRVVVVVDP